MSKAIANEIRKLLKIKSTDSDERLQKYKRFIDAYTPVMFGLFILPCALSAYGVMLPQLALLIFYVNMDIAFALSFNVRLYMIDEALKKDVIDTDAIKQQLSNFKAKNVYKAKKVWGVLCWVYACFFFVSQLLLLFCLAFFILDGYSINGVVSCILLMYINQTLYNGIKVRSRVYKVLVLLEEYDNRGMGVYEGE